jgi:hypothetical protein
MVLSSTPKSPREGNALSISPFLAIDDKTIDLHRELPLSERLEETGELPLNVCIYMYVAFGMQIHTHKEKSTSSPFLS